MSDRRRFIKQAGLALLPAVVTPDVFNQEEALDAGKVHGQHTTASPVNFVSDGELVSPGAYISKLAAIDKQSPILADSYGSGGAVESLQKKLYAKYSLKQKW